MASSRTPSFSANTQLSHSRLLQPASHPPLNTAPPRGCRQLPHTHTHTHTQAAHSHTPAHTHLQSNLPAHTDFTQVSAVARTGFGSCADSSRNCAESPPQLSKKKCRGSATGAAVSEREVATPGCLRTGSGFVHAEYGFCSMRHGCVGALSKSATRCRRKQNQKKFKFRVAPKSAAQLLV